MSSSVLAIETRGLTKDYPTGFWRTRPHRALDRLDLEVATGEVFGFLGPNGAGKTTTLKLLMQLVYPTSGGAAIFGRPVGDVGVVFTPSCLPRAASPLTSSTTDGYFASKSVTCPMSRAACFATAGVSDC